MASLARRRRTTVAADRQNLRVPCRICAGCSEKNLRNRHLCQTSHASRPIRSVQHADSGRVLHFRTPLPLCLSGLYLSSSYLSKFGVSVMNPNRPTRNAQQVRSIIQNMGRSIDEARSRRLGPSLPPSAGSALPAARASGGSSVNPMDMQIGSAEVPAPKLMPAQPTETPVTPTSNTPTTPPPVRSVGEMFESGAPRLKARPKNAS